MFGKNTQKVSKDWKNQGPVFPNIGKKSRKFSKHWKKWAALFPIIGKLSTGASAPAADLPPLIGTNESAHLVLALQHLNMTPPDLAFAKDHGQPDPVLTRTRRLLAEPLELPRLADRVRAAAPHRPRELWAIAFSCLEAKPSVRPAPPATPHPPIAPPDLSPGLRKALNDFYRAALKADAMLEHAFSSLTRADMDYLAGSHFAGLFNARDRAEVRNALADAGCSSALVREVIEESEALDPAPAASNFLVRLRRVPLGRLLEAGRCLHGAAQKLAAVSPKDWPIERHMLETPLGPIVLGTPGDDEYAERALLIFDPGGDDVYSGAAGIADGRAGSRLAVIVDLCGNDRYAGSSLLGPGTALFGAAVLLDAHGNDVHQQAYTGAAAAFCGTAWLEDCAGNDTYRAGGFAQAAATWGAAIFYERGGDDVYEVGLAGQACSGVMAFALLADRAGNDRYLAGGREPDHERNDDRYLSLAQGFSIGLRPWAGGGVAALVDLAGNDTYQADIFGQGASYWYGAGLLLDAAGNDTYRLFQYGQGAGIHLSCGLLADYAGHDDYTGRTLVQGAAHDYGVGLLFDREGDDTYTAGVHAQGRAMNNALALLLDSAGDDAYFARQSDQCQGIGNDGGYRDYGSLALLLDLAGGDRYTCGAADGTRMKRPDFGLVYDVKHDEPPRDKP